MKRKFITKLNEQNTFSRSESRQWPNGSLFWPTLSVHFILLSEVSRTSSFSWGTSFCLVDWKLLRFVHWRSGNGMTLFWKPPIIQKSYKIQASFSQASIVIHYSPFGQFRMSCLFPKQEIWFSSYSSDQQLKCCFCNLVWKRGCKLTMWEGSIPSIPQTTNIYLAT